MNKRRPGSGHRMPVPPRPQVEVKPRARREAIHPSPAPAVQRPVIAEGEPKTSGFPLIAFALIAVIGLGLSGAAVVMHMLTEVKPPEFTEEILKKELVPVEPAEADDVTDDIVMTEGVEEDLPDNTTPALMTTAGNPILVRRQQSVPRQIAKIEGEAAKAAASLKLPGEVFKMTDTLAAPGGGLSAGVPGSQLDFAFAQSPVADEDAGDAVPDAEDTQQDATILTAGAGEDSMEAGPTRTLVMKTVEAEAPLAELMTGAGFDADMAKSVGAAFKSKFQLEKLAKGSGIVALGFKSYAADGSYIPAQVAVYNGATAIGTMAITDLGTYQEGANPWQGQEIFQDEDVGPPPAKLRLLDVIYNAAVRNKLSTTVAGEIILLLSRNNDLEQTANGSESMLLLFGSKARDKKSGLGRVLYVRVDRGADGAMECYSFQPKPGAPFECVSGDGQGVASGGMITPVRGTIAAKFGPVRDKATKKRRMNYGVDWAAAPGSAVVAAFGGKVLSAGGGTVKLSHDGGQVTVYSNLKTIGEVIVAGRAIKPGQRLGTVGLTGKQAEALLHFELLRNGQPVDPFGEYQAQVEKGGAIEAMVYRITTIESGNKCHAKNPLSSAAGLGQFIISTWLTTIARHRPDLMEGRTRAQVLDLRYDCAIALEMTTALTRENANYIRSRGHPVTPGNLYLAHFLGPGGAAQALGSSSDTPVLSAFGALVVKQNPFLDGWSCSMLINWAARKMTAKGKAPVIAPSPGAAKAKSFASNAQFVKLKDAVTGMLN